MDGWGLGRLASPLRRTLTVVPENAVLNSDGAGPGLAVSGGESRRREGGSCSPGSSPHWNWSYLTDAVRQTSAPGCSSPVSELFSQGGGT